MVRRGGTANVRTRKLSSEATAPIGAQRIRAVHTIAVYVVVYRYVYIIVSD